MTAGVEVLIVGAGPVGLFLAAELVRHGVRPRIVERRGTVAPYSRAIAIQPRTLEALAPSGLTDRLEKFGVRTTKARMVIGSERIDLPLDTLDTPYPHVLIVPQSDTERLLTAHLETLGVTIERDRELVMLAADGGNGVEVTLRGDDGFHELRADYLVGCDGSHSTVRKQLDVTFEGDELPIRFAIADVDLPWRGSRDEIWLFMSQHGLCALFPLPDSERHWRVVADLRPEDPQDISLERVTGLLLERAGIAARAERPTTLMTWAVSERVAEAFRVGNVLLAGDAAHVYSPVGNQGMNTGLQDAHNLAWKLALVLRGSAATTLLDTYEAERRPIAQRVLWDTHQATRAATTRGGLTQLFRTRVMGFLAGFDVLQRSVVDRATEIDVNYRGSPIVSQEGRPTDRLEAGDHVPDVRWGPQTSLERLQGTRHLVLLMDGGPSNRVAHSVLLQIADLVVRRFGEDVDAYVVMHEDVRPDWLPKGGRYLLDPTGALHARLTVRAPAALVIRPDGFLGYVGGPPDAKQVLAHLTGVLGP